MAKLEDIKNNIVDIVKGILQYREKDLDEQGWALVKCAEKFFLKGCERMVEELENNRLARCEKASGDELAREMHFVYDFIEEHNCQPTFSDAIETTRMQMVKKACKTYCDLMCERGMCGMCYHKHDHKGQIKNDFKYNECNELQLIRREMETD